MKRIRSTQGWNFDSLALFRDDLEELLRIFNPTGAPDALTISDGDNEYTSLDELQKEKGDRISHLIVRSRKPWIGMELRKNPRLLGLYTFETTDEADIAFYGAKELLLPKRRPLNYFLAFVLPLTCIVGWLVGTALVLTNFHMPSKLLPWGLFVYLAMFVVVIAWRELDEISFYFVSLRKRHESPGFFRRKRDELVMLFIGALIGIIGALVVRHFQK